jgi:hypothetical protein
MFAPGSHAKAISHHLKGDTRETSRTSRALIADQTLPEAIRLEAVQSLSLFLQDAGVNTTLGSEGLQGLKDMNGKPLGSASVEKRIAEALRHYASMPPQVPS